MHILKRSLIDHISRNRWNLYEKKCIMNLSASTVAWSCACSSTTFSWLNWDMTSRGIGTGIQIPYLLTCTPHSLFPSNSPQTHTNELPMPTKQSQHRYLCQLKINGLQHQYIITRKSWKWSESWTQFSTREPQWSRTPVMWYRITLQPRMCQRNRYTTAPPQY